MKKPQYLLFLFWLFAVVTIISEGLGWQAGIYFTKPLILTTLSLWFYGQTKDLSSIFSRFMLLGFIFSIAGDTFLMFSNRGAESYFLFGLGSFLLAQISFTIAFVKFPNFKSGILFSKTWLVIPLMLFFAGIISYLWSGLDQALQIPVIIYALAITLMALSCLNMFGRVPGGVFELLFVGALFFLLSDSLIAVDKFKTVGLEPGIVRILIMLSYVIAQFLLAKGGLMAAKQKQ